MGQWRKLIRNKKVDAVTAVLNRVLIPLKDSCHTITFDTGKEFAGHKSIASALQVEIHFVDHFRAGERALNKSSIGLLLQYFPRATAFTRVSAEQVNYAGI